MVGMRSLRYVYVFWVWWWRGESGDESLGGEGSREGNSGISGS